MEVRESREKSPHLHRRSQKLRSWARRRGPRQPSRPAAQPRGEPPALSPGLLPQGRRVWEPAPRVLSSAGWRPKKAVAPVPHRGTLRSPKSPSSIFTEPRIGRGSHTASHGWLSLVCFHPHPSAHHLLSRAAGQLKQKEPESSGQSGLTCGTDTAPYALPPRHTPAAHPEPSVPSARRLY